MRSVGRRFGSVAVALLVGSALALGQDQPLLVVGRDTTTAGEFLYSYQKNREVRAGGDTLTLRGFLASYVVYRLKVADALRLRLDTLRKYRGEYARYRNAQLGSVLLPGEAVEARYRAAYARLQREVDASHILVSVSAGRSDSAALRKAVALRLRLMAGADFDSLARRESDDVSARRNGGHLGYFSAFTMIAPFELAAFSTPVGEVSAPVRTPFGYHLIKVHDARPSRGRMRIAHIMVRAPEGVSGAQRDTARAQIERAYEAARAGVPFDTLMKQYSPSIYQAGAEARHSWVRMGSVPGWFGERVFSLREDGAVSAPFSSAVGWHIIKRLAHEAVPPYDEARDRLRALMRQSGESVDDEAALVRAARGRVGARECDSGALALARWTQQAGLGAVMPESLASLPVGELEGKALLVSNFSDWARAEGIGILGMPREALRGAIARYIDGEALARAAAREAMTNRQFGYLIREFHDGLLLFDVSDRKVWGADLTTEAALQSYYNAHRGALRFDTCYTVEEYSAADSKFLEAMARKFRGEARLRLTNKIMEAHGVAQREMRLGSEHPLMYGYGESGKEGAGRVGRMDSWRKECLGPVSRNGGSKLYRVKGVAMNVPMSYEESKPLMRARLQEEREQAWVEELRKAIGVEVKEEALRWVEKQLGKAGR